MEDEEDTTYNSESDETVTLSEIVTGREVTLREEEIWALCRECCLTLEFVHSTQELFQSLVITPETVAFDRDGNVCFLDLDADPEPLYIPPEYEEDGCSYKSHLFSLGMTLLFAVEYSSNPDENIDNDSKSALSKEVRDLLTHLTQDDPENRPDIELVLEYCDRALQDISSQDVCQRFACVPTEEEIPKEGGTSLLSMTEELAAYLNNQNGLVTPGQQHYDCDSGKQVSSSSNSSNGGSHQQQVLSAETQTAALPTKGARNVKPEIPSCEKKDTAADNPTSPSMELSQSSAGDDSSLASPRKGRRRQGLLLSDILSALERDLQEAELWALCRECVVSLQRKKKHLPAYISPDTVMVREVGSVSFKAIPEDKPLEVIYMAPELQQKGILNEKTCMYGLGVTLRCAAGHRQGGVDSTVVGLAFHELLTTLLDTNPDHRPSLEVCLLACDEFEKQGSTDSRLLCQEIYMDACALNSSREPKKSETSADLEDSALMATELQTSWTELEEADKEGGAFLEEPVEAEGEVAAMQTQPKAQSFQPVPAKQQDSSASGLAFKVFKPKPGKMTEAEDKPSQPAFPSAFSSPANYFKPIVLESAASSKSADNHVDVGHAATEDEEREKNVMQKLREIKKNLLKHRPPGSLTKDVEVDDSKPPVAAAAEKTRTPRSTTSGRSSRKSSSAGETAGVLENLLQQLQSSGQLPDTDNLALAIAQHLQARLGAGGEGGAAGEELKASPASAQHSSEPDRAKSESLQPPVTTSSAVNASSPSAVKTVSSDSQPGSVVSPLSQPPVPSSVSLPGFGGQVGGLGVAGVSQAGYMPMPVMPFPGGLMPGPVQYHLQQDPRTGLLQLVPVTVMPYGAPHSPHAPGSDHGHTPWQQPLTVNTGSGVTLDRPADGDETFQRLAVKTVSSRNARGLIQKTASQRAKNAVSASASPTGYLSDSGAGFSSPYADDSVLHRATNFPNENGSNHRRSKSSGALEFVESTPVRRGDVGDSIEEEPLTLPQDKTRPSNSRNVCGDKSPQVHHRSSSQSSSPSPSKDSGICLTQGAGGAPPVSSASLMERLLSSESLRHQHTVTQVLHILHQAFGDQGPDSFHSEEMLAEYIVSLTHLKWETFMHAVTEKYSQFFWSHGLLVNLFNAINKQSSTPSRSSAPTHPSGADQSVFGKDKGSQQSYDHRTTDPDRPHRQSGPHSAEAGEHSQASTEMPQRSEDVRNNQRSRPERGPGPGRGTEAAETPSLVRVLPNGRYISGPSETSDSTDNEQEEKRRRFKKRYELDRNKSASLHSLPGTAQFSVPPEQGVSSAGEGRVQGHGDDLRTAKLCASRGDREAGGAEWGFRSDLNPAKTSSPGTYHSLPRPPKSFHPPHSQSPSRDGVSPSHSNISGFPTSHKGVHSHSPSGGETLTHTSQQPRSQFGATPHSQSSQWHSQHMPGGTDSRVLQRPESRDAHRPYRDASHQHGPDRISLNNSSGSSSYSPAFNQNIRDGAGKRHPEHTHHTQPSSQAELEAQGFVYGQLREPLGKPPSNTRNLHNTHSPNRQRQQGDNRNSVPVFPSHHPPSETNRNSVPPFTSQGRSEVNNNNAPKQDVGDRRSRSSQPSSPRNRDRSPVRKTQHKVKPRLAWDQEIAEYRKKGQVVYHSAMIQLSMTPEVDHFIHGVDEKNKPFIEAKLASLDQEIGMLRRERRKSQAFYKRLTDPGVKQPKGDNKGVVSQVLKDMLEMTGSLRYLDLCRTHLQMLLAELHGVHTSFLHSVVTGGSSGRGRGEEDGQPLTLQRCPDNQWLQFQTVREAGGLEVQVLQAGHPEGLLAYLFTVSALSDGYIHQFLFCFRYFLRAEDVFTFITQKYTSAHRGNQNDPDIVRVQQRAVDVLQFWVEGYYSVDFERNDSLLDRLEAFVMQRVGEGMEGSQNMMNLLYACHLGENSELIRQADDAEDQDEVYYLHLASPKRWESFRSLLGRRKSEGTGKAGGRKEEKGLVVEKRPASRAEEGGSTLTLSRRTDVAHLMDYSPHRLAEQLTLMEQELFHRTHPVHYLDSKSQGVGVDLSIPSLHTPSMSRKAKPGAQSLFVGATLFEPRISELISHSQEITHWVSAEILCCGSQKSQVAALTKFLQTAQLCVEIRNYATALAIVAGLDNLLVRQLPAWKHLPAKITALMEDLEAEQVKLKGEPMALMQTKDSHICPTIPCVLYFLLHLQQLEIGGFTLANGMYKWQKMRSISQMIDQIRIFREHEYGFEPDIELQSLICRRLHELSDRDLHSVAAAHDNNFRRVVSHAAGLQGTWRKVKVKLQSRSK
ncbi:uncharacterized protein LOC143293637 isoform X2 [Babylonia areolata]|uniref:uncharacterized protein LOC143293637 isoform X2 n=1 Tax=Babylonia areolata TaxID=304850 RepID=UPI003FD44DB7